VEPFITHSKSAVLRKKAWELWTKRGELDVNRDNLEVAKKILGLRVQQAQMHGFDDYSQFALADTMAGSPERVMELLEVRKGGDISVYGVWG
jgi:peptidyl-dipeptidase Dcp